MTDVVAVSIVTACATLLGALMGAIPSFLKYKLDKRRVAEDRIRHVHEQTIQLMKVNLERVRLLEVSKGVYATHEQPMILYWKFFQWLRKVDAGLSDLQRDVPPEIRQFIANEIHSLGREPGNYGLGEETGQGA